MTARTWVGANGATFTTSTNWSPSGTPTSADDLTFSTNSLGAAITATATCRSITVSGTGVTISGTAQLTVSSGITLNAATTWSHSGTLVLSGTGTLTTNGVSIGSNVSQTASGATTSLAGNFNGTGTFICSGGSLSLSNYQWICSTFTSTGTTATTLSCFGSGGITVTANSGTVVNVTKTAAQLTLSTPKPLFTLTAAGTAANRGITWTGTTWATSTSTMPGLKITNGSDTVTITQTASQTNYNLESLNTTGFTGTLTYASAPTYLNVYKDFVVPTGTAGSIGVVYLYGVGYNFASITSSVYFDSAAVYTQVGDIACNYVGLISYFTTGSLTLNNTGIISKGFGVTGVTLVGDITFGAASAAGITLDLPIITSLTSITKTAASGDTGQFRFFRGTYGSSIPITFNGTGNNPRFDITTISGTITYSSASAINSFQIYGSTFANPIIVTCNGVSFSSTVNIPSSSVFTVNATGTAYYTAYGASDPIFTNKFTVNINATTTGTVYIYSDTSGISDTVNAPDVYLSGSSAVVFNDSSYSGYTPYFSSLDTTSYTGGSITGAAYIANSLVQSPSYPAPFSILLYQYTGSSSTFTLNSTSISDFFNPGLNKTINITSSTLAISGSGGLNFYVSAGTVNLNSCVITLGTAFGTFNVSTATVNAGTSTITSQATNSILSFGSNNIYNVVVASGTTRIISPYVNSLTNSSQPVTVEFASNVTLGTFGLNGTAGNLVTVKSNGTTVRTITKSSPWDLGNSTDSGNNTGITFLGSGSGDNNYLDVSYIDGVYVPVATGNGWGASTWGSYAWGGTIEGVAASGAVGSVTASKSFALTGVSANGSVGTVALGARSLALTGVAASGAVGTVTETNTTPETGDQANGFVGTVVASTSFALTGVAAAGSVGTITPSVSVELGTTWGYNTWGSGSWGGLTAPAFGAVGDVTETNTTPETGDQANGSVGSVAANLTKALTGVAATGAVGTVVSGQGLSGVQANGAVGAVVRTETRALTGVTAAGAVGSVAPTLTKALTGVAASGAVGTVVDSNTTPETGDQANGFVGSVTVSKSFALTGAAAAGAVGTLPPSTTVALGFSWGYGTWGSGSWGGVTAPAFGAVGDVSETLSLALTGVSLSGAVGSAAANLTKTLTGVAATGAVGAVIQGRAFTLTGVLASGAVGSVASGQGISGVAATGSVGTLTPSITVALGFSWGYGTWGSNSWGGLIAPALGTVGDVADSLVFALTGVAANGAVGSVAVDKTKALTGVAASGAVGTAAPSTTVSLVPNWGSQAWGIGSWGGQLAFISGDVGAVAQTQTRAITGVPATGAVGTLTPNIIVALGTTWGSGAWGSSSWGGLTSPALGSTGLVGEAVSIALTGVAATGLAGAINAAFTKTSTGVAAIGTVGSVISAITITPTGVVAEASEGTVFTPTAFPISGVSASGAVGTLASSRTVALTGVSASGLVGIPGTSKALTGVQASGAVGLVTSGQAITGVQAAGAVGTVSQGGFVVALTGVGSTGSVTTPGAGQGLAGVLALGSVGSLAAFYWTLIDDAENADWVVIPDAQTPNWSNVGNAQNSDWAVIPNPQTSGWTEVTNEQTADWQIAVDA